MTRTVAVIQARLGSQRFPGKMLAELGGHSLIEWVVTRVKASTSLNRVLVATTTEALDDRLMDICASLDVEVYRGSTSDVLDRFASAIRDDPADAVVRVCADNPFVDPDCIDEAVRMYRASNADYVFNHRPLGTCNYADGFGVEVVKRELLDHVNSMQLSARHREHVTLAIADGTVGSTMYGCPAPEGLARPDLAFDVDQPADLERLQHLVEAGNLGMKSTASEVVVVAAKLLGSDRR